MGRRRQKSQWDGFFVIDKAAGLTSHDVVGQVRRSIGESRVGHAGTLDPDATGVLVVGVGRTTRLLRFVSDLSKRYEAEVVFGQTTSTLDASGEVKETFSMPDVTLEKVQEGANKLTGAIEQIPPMVSAIKIDGRRLYELAREGKEVERAPRHVVVEKFLVVPTGDPMVFRIDVTCSSGTYVRSLAADLGELLGGGAHLRNLRRVAIGPFGLDKALRVEQVTPENLSSPRELLRHLAELTVEYALVDRIRHGQFLDASLFAGCGDGPYVVVAFDELLGIYERYSPTQMKPMIILIDPDGPSDQQRSDQSSDDQSAPNESGNDEDVE